MGGPAPSLHRESTDSLIVHVVLGIAISLHPSTFFEKKTRHIMLQCEGIQPCFFPWSLLDYAYFDHSMVQCSPVDIYIPH